ncbi:MAG: phage virion morphogenesis protein [Thiobacillus sp.]|jgi:phage virion morphogenesis protein|uniref:phage virion morphogenesis protein n=1 Tax=Thiobacillus sp. TaxID=924 RepID=UPI002894C23A|nr:phage virion morphogenesis protein [Thiobacillus sp.]MDT3707430.1 phage virion morphogenesis protein [Thiobacillus sp.]
MIKIDITDNGVQEALNRLANAGNELRPVLEHIGEFLVDSTRQRFATSTAPDGTRWAPNTETTILMYLGRYKGSFSKRDGLLTKKGAGRATGKRPLIGETGDLSRQISHHIEGKDTLYIGSSMIYAATQQFGAKRREFQGKAPWGDIPARPFLGLSESDRRTILDIIGDFLV